MESQIHLIKIMPYFNIDEKILISLEHEAENEIESTYPRSIEDEDLYIEIGKEPDLSDFGIDPNSFKPINKLIENRISKSQFWEKYILLIIPSLIVLVDICARLFFKKSIFEKNTDSFLEIFIFLSFFSGLGCLIKTNNLIYWLLFSDLTNSYPGLLEFIAAKNKYYTKKQEVRKTGIRFKNRLDDWKKQPIMEFGREMKEVFRKFRCQITMEDIDANYSCSFIAEYEQNLYLIVCITDVKNRENEVLEEIYKFVAKSEVLFSGVIIIDTCYFDKQKTEITGINKNNTIIYVLQFGRDDMYSLYKTPFKYGFPRNLEFKLHTFEKYKIENIRNYY